MAFLILIIGFIATVIAAAPPGAANVAVVNTAINNSSNKVHLLIIGAGFGEMSIALLTLHCTTNFSQFFQQNMWVQVVVFSLFILIGLSLLLKKYLPKSNLNKHFNLKPSSLIRGFLFAFVNPPVLLFWLLAFALIRMYAFHISEMSMASTLILFFIGIFLGKVSTLYAYALWGKKMDNKAPNSKNKIYSFIGFALILVGLIQAIKFFYF